MKKVGVILFIIFCFNIACQREKSDNTTMRQIGDKIVGSHAEPVNFKDRKRIEHCLRVMKDVQSRYQLIGLSCNQCIGVKRPVQIAFIGSDDPETIENIQKHYPDKEIPPLIIMINLKIIKFKDPYYPKFGEACSSVHGPIMGKTKRYRSITVEYYDLDGNKKVKDFSGFTAHIIQHEFDHLKGVIYIEKIFLDCSINQREKILNLINKEISSRKNSNKSHYYYEDDMPLLVFDRDTNRNEQKVVVDYKKLEQALKKMPLNTLIGLKESLISLNNVDAT